MDRYKIGIDPIQNFCKIAIESILNRYKIDPELIHNQYRTDIYNQYTIDIVHLQCKTNKM